MLQLARGYAADNLGASVIGPIAEPPDAVKVWPWQNDRFNDGSWWRMFTGAPRQLGETTLQIYGNQSRTVASNEVC